MTRQLDQQNEQKVRSQNDRLAMVLDYGLTGALEGQGVEFCGLSLKGDSYSVLMTLRVVISGAAKVTHVGAPTIGACFLRAYDEARSDGLQWHADKYRT
jgi:hypothetical protein